MIIRIITNCGALVFTTNNFMKDKKIKIIVVENEVAKK
jgi:hypothetical protein